jgi:hypothetical protein
MKAMVIGLTFLLFSTSIGLAQNSANKLAKVSDQFQKYQLKETNVPEKWEDGIRTTGGKGTYEWWYFDTHLADGSTMVIVFYTKNFIKIDKALLPSLTINIDKADGTKINRAIEFDPANFSASKDSCNVQIGKNYFRGNLKTYDIHFEDTTLNLDVHIDRTTESWRPKTGHMVFGPDEKRYFAWVVSVPQGIAQVNYTHQGITTTSKGSCYHDHNWGNVGMTELFNHWYWSRAEIGPYNVIASEMISEREFNNDNIVVFNVSKNGKTIADNGDFVKMFQTYGKLDPLLKKDVSNDLVFIYNNPTDSCRYEYYLTKQKELVNADLLMMAVGKGVKYHLAKCLTGFDGGYFRFGGVAEIKVYKNDRMIENYTSNTAVWELMYFGKPHQ